MDTRVMEPKDWDRLFEQGTYVHAFPDPEVVAFAAFLTSRNAVRVLDLGCGYGRHLHVFAERGFLAVGVDWSAAALRMARASVSRQERNKVLLVRADIENLPFSDSCFDALVSSKVLQHCRSEKRRKVVSEIERVVRKGGKAMITVASIQHPEYGLGAEVERGTFLMESGPHRGVVQHYFGEIELRKLFGRFRILEVHLDSAATHVVLALEKP